MSCVEGEETASYVRKHMHLLKLAVERLGGWPKDYSESSFASARPFPKLLIFHFSMLSVPFRSFPNVLNNSELSLVEWSSSGGSDASSPGVEGEETASYVRKHMHLLKSFASARPFPKLLIFHFSMLSVPFRSFPNVLNNSGSGGSDASSPGVEGEETASYVRKHMHLLKLAVERMWGPSKLGEHPHVAPRPSCSSGKLVRGCRDFPDVCVCHPPGRRPHVQLCSCPRTATSQHRRDDRATFDHSTVSRGGVDVGSIKTRRASSCSAAAFL
jgi:hypothetical protein